MNYKRDWNSHDCRHSLCQINRPKAQDWWQHSSNIKKIWNQDSLNNINCWLVTSDDVICLQVARQESIVKDTCTQEKSSLSSAGMHGCFRQEVTSESEGETQLAAAHRYLQEHPRLYIINAVYLRTLQAIFFVCVFGCFFKKTTNLAVIYQTWVLPLPKESRNPQDKPSVE